MHRSEMDPIALAKSLRLALDVVMAHRIARGLSLDRAVVTSIRDTIEEHTVLSLEQVDRSEMPESWSWEMAAEAISVQAALAIVNQQKSEPRADQA